MRPIRIAPPSGAGHWARDKDERETSNDHRHRGRRRRVDRAVSFALNNRPGVSVETRARILRVAKQMGWQPSAAARGLSASKAEAIGLVIAREAATLGVEPFYMRFIAGLETELSTSGTALSSRSYRITRRRSRRCARCGRPGASTPPS